MNEAGGRPPLGSARYQEIAMTTRAAVPLLLASILAVAASARGDELATAHVAAASLPASAQDGTDLRHRFAGTYRYVGDAREQRARQEAIDRAVSTFFFAVRGLARAKIEDRTRIVPTCKFEFPTGKIRSTVPGHPVATSPDDGTPTSYRVEDDAIVLRQRFDGARLVQSFTADEGGTRMNELTLSADGNILTMKATVSSPKLKTPIVYTLTYARTN